MVLKLTKGQLHSKGRGCYQDWAIKNVSGPRDNVDAEILKLGIMRPFPTLPKFVHLFERPMKYVHFWTLRCWCPFPL